MSLAERLRAALDAADAGALLRHEGPVFPGEPVPAAVLIAITDRPAPGVILTLRQASLRSHSGQYAFPGGRIDASDDGPIAGALREAQEEIGLDPAAVEVIAEWPAFTTGSGYAIVPVIGVTPPDPTLTPHEAEVAAVFEVPLAFLIDPANHRSATIAFGGQERRITEIIWREHRIWGITAGIIVNLSRALRGFA